MRLKSFLMIPLFSFLFSACLIKSFNPFYHEEQVVFDESIPGTWMDQDSGIWKFEQFKTTASILRKDSLHDFYLLRYNGSEGTESAFHVRLFNLGGKQYLDFFPDLESLSGKDLFAMHLLPVHSLAEIEISSDSDILVRWFNEEWLSELLQSNAADISYVPVRYSKKDDPIPVLTASTDKLQQFIMTYRENPRAFDCEDQFSGDTYCRNLTRQ